MNPPSSPGSNSHNHFPSFPVRTGPTPRSGPVPRASTAAPSKTGLSLKSKLPSNKGVEDEYIRNLQQQVYLLELETRYLKNRRGEDDDESQESPSAPLRDTFRHLKMKYVELQEKFKKDIKSLEEQVDSLENEKGIRQHRIEVVEQENSTLRSDLDQLRAARENQNDILHTEHLALRQEHELLESENKRLQSSYDRIVSEKMALESTLTQKQLNVEQLETELKIQGEKVAILQESSNVSIRKQVELQAELNPLHKTPADAIQTSNQELILENTALRTQILRVQTEMSALEAHNDKLKSEAGRLAAECTKLETDSIEAKREESRVKETLMQEREQARMEKELREKRRRELANGDESLLDSEDVEIALLKREVEDSQVVARIKEERIQDLELHIQEAHDQVSQLKEQILVGQEQFDSVTVQIKQREEENVITEEERRSLRVALEQVQASYEKLQTSDQELQSNLSKREVDLEAAKKEVARLKHLQRVAQQMQEWKNMMEESSKVAVELKSLVNAFADGTAADEEKLPQQAQGSKKGQNTYVTDGSSLDSALSGAKYPQ